MISIIFKMFFFVLDQTQDATTDIVVGQGLFHMSHVLELVDPNPGKDLEKGHLPQKIQNCVQHVDRDRLLDGHVPDLGVAHGPKVLKKWQKSLWNPIN